MHATPPDPNASACPRCLAPLAGTVPVCAACGHVLDDQAREDPLLGRVIADTFRVQELIGTGGMGRVYRGEHLALARTVAIKVIHPHLLGDPSSVGRFYREVRAASRLNHPNSVAVLEFGRTDDGLLYLVMEYLRGRDLGRVMYEDWPLPFERVAHITHQILAALGEAHENGVIHRDLKPENILVETLRMGGDLVKVVDFGLAKLADPAQPSLTRPGVVCGTPEYMAPEHGGGEETDARSDLYSVGVVLFQMLTGKLPFEGDSPTKTLLAHMTEPVPDPTLVAPERRIPAPVARATMRALAKVPSERFQSAVEMERLLSEAWAEARAAMRRASQPSAGGAAPLVCAACGTANVGTSRFCSACGARLSALSDRKRSMSERSDDPERQGDDLLGRETLLHRLAELRAIAGVQPVVALVTGPVGAGKTRVLAELARRARDGGSLVVSVGPHPSGAPVAYHAAHQLLRGLLGLGPELAATAFVDALPPAERCSTIERSGLAELERPAGNASIEPSSRWRAAAKALRWALERASSADVAGVVLIADDLTQWDGASRSVITQLVRELLEDNVPVLLVAAAACAVEELGHEVVELPLDGLSLDDAARLVEPGLPVPSTSPPPGRTILPMLAEQLAQLGTEAGMTMASRVADVVAIRLERLPTTARRILQAASAIGMVASRPAIAALLPRHSEADVTRATRTLERLRLVRIEGDDVHVAHPLVRDIAEAGTPAELRRELHGRCLDFLVSAGGTPLEVRARHAQQGDDAFGALLLLERAGDRAAQLGQLPEATAWLRAGLELARREVLRGELDSAERAVLSFARKLGETMIDGGDAAGADGVLREALAMRIQAPTDRLRVLCVLARAAVARGRLDEADRFLDAALSATEVIDRRVMAELWAEAARVWEAAGRRRDALDALRHASTIYLAASNSAARARVLLRAAELEASLGEREGALSALALAEDSARQAEIPALIAEARGRARSCTSGSATPRRRCATTGRPPSSPRLPVTPPGGSGSAAPPRRWRTADPRVTAGARSLPCRREPPAEGRATARQRGLPLGTSVAPCFGSMRCTVSVFALFLVAVPACDQVVEQPVTYGPVAFAMTSDTPPAIANEDGEGLYVVLLPVELPLRAPTADELNALMAAPAVMPFPSAIWLHEGDISMTADLVLTNLDDEEHVLKLVLEARTEFHQHVPNVALDDMGDVAADFASYEQTVILPPGSRTHRRITDEELSEVAIDFATVINGAPSANQVFYFLNQHTHDPRNDAFIPPVIPGLVGFNLGLRSESPVNVAVELSLTLVDQHDRVAREGDTLWELPEPEIVTPVPPPEEP